jgi:aprataxin
MSCKRHHEDEEKKDVKKAANHWSMGLLSSMKDPELLIKEDDKVVAIKDKYPKVYKHNCTRVSQHLESTGKVLNLDYE